MTEEKTTRTTVHETQAPGDARTDTTMVVTETRTGGSAWVWAFIALLVVVGGFFIFDQMSDAEIAKDNAVAEAAENVGDAAQSVGDAAQDVGEAAEEAVDSVTE